MDVDGVHISKAEEMTNALNEYFTTLKAASPNINYLDTTQSEKDKLLQCFVESRVDTASAKPFEIPPITKDIVEQDF